MKNKLNILSIVLFSLLPFYSHAQVVIGQNTDSPDASAELQIETKSAPADVGGLILPQLEDKSYNVFSVSWGKEIRKGLLLQNGGTTNILKFKGATGQVNSDALWDIVDPWITTKIAAKSYKLDFAINSPGSLVEGGNFTNIDFKGAVLSGNVEVEKVVKAERIDNSTLGVTPIGGIIMWSGAIGDIPDGWILCDGEDYNKLGKDGISVEKFKAPDLSGKFIVGYDVSDADFAKGKTGGAKTVKLTVAQMPSHNHQGSTQSGGEHNHSIKDPGHSHNMTYHHKDVTGRDVKRFIEAHNPNSSDQMPTSKQKTGITINNSGNHSHGINSSGGDQSHQNLPPYYTLAYIMYTGVVQ